MNYQNGQTSISKGKNLSSFKRSSSVRLERVSLRDVPLEDRRKEAKKPLFLTRYE